MKLEVTFEATCYKTKLNVMEPKNRNESPITWYQILIDQNDDVCTLTCSEDVHNKAVRGMDYVFSAVFDGDSKRFKVVDCEIIPSASPSPTPGKSRQTAEAPAKE